MLPEPLAVTLMVIDVLNELNIPYALGGSWASALHGTARSTLDSDLIVQLSAQDVKPFISKLTGHFYVDESMASGAVNNHSSFNLIHLETMFKVDIFVAGDTPFDQAQLSRRILQPVDEEGQRSIYILSAEDTILAKLAWYRLGGEQSERQWRDVEGVLKVQGDRLDFDYMAEMAKVLKVNDLLDRLLNE